MTVNNITNRDAMTVNKSNEDKNMVVTWAGVPVAYFYLDKWYVTASYARTVSLVCQGVMNILQLPYINYSVTIN